MAKTARGMPQSIETYLIINCTANRDAIQNTKNVNHDNKYKQKTLHGPDTRRRTSEEGERCSKHAVLAEQLTGETHR